MPQKHYLIWMNRQNIDCVYITQKKTAAVVQWVRALALHAEEWMYEPQSRQT